MWYHGLDVRKITYDDYIDNEIYYRQKSGRRFRLGCRRLMTPLLRRMRGYPGSASSSVTRMVRVDCTAFTAAVKLP